MKSINDPFLRMAFYSVLGAVLGILAGFLLALLIRALYIVFLASEYTQFVMQGLGMMVPFLGMGFGAVIGGLLGGVVGIRRKD